MAIKRHNQQQFLHFSQHLVHVFLIATVWGLIYMNEKYREACFVLLMFLWCIMQMINIPKTGDLIIVHMAALPLQQQLSLRAQDVLKNNWLKL